MNAHGAPSDAICAQEDGRVPNLEPIVVLTFPYSGDEMLGGTLSASPDIVCTSRTGVVPLCHIAARTWENIEGRARSSRLALASIRSLISLMSTVLIAESGARRWCETVVSGAPPVATFLRVFPGATVICFYRRCDTTMADVFAKNPYGLGNTEFWEHALSQQGDGVAAVAAYWIERVEAMLEFEMAHAQSTIRVRLEDMQRDENGVLDAVCALLHLQPRSWPCSSVMPGTVARGRDEASEARLDLLTERIPAVLRKRVNELHATLGYPEF
jgi:Sulfotransferase family